VPVGWLSVRAVNICIYCYLEILNYFAINYLLDYFIITVDDNLKTLVVISLNV
jgi:hypothetical protein